MTQSVIRNRVCLVDLREEPLVVDEVLASLDDETSGAVNLFVGRVRDHDGGRSVNALDYAAHPSALARLREVSEQVAEEFEVTGISAVHRVGALAIGDTAVIVAAAAAHRGTAYDASRALIDRLKAEVPIWKQQSFADGDTEWVGSP